MAVQFFLQVIKVGSKMEASLSREDVFVLSRKKFELAKNKCLRIKGIKIHVSSAAVVVAVVKLLEFATPYYLL